MKYHRMPKTCCAIVLAALAHGAMASGVDPQYLIQPVAPVTIGAQVQEVIDSYKIDAKEKKVIMLFAKSAEHMATVPYSLMPGPEQKGNIGAVKNMLLAAACMYEINGNVSIKVAAHLVELSTATSQRKDFLKTYNDIPEISGYLPQGKQACASIEAAGT